MTDISKDIPFQSKKKLAGLDGLNSQLATTKKKVGWIDVVEDFGADPNGVLDSTVAIQNALNSAKTLIINNNFTKLVQVIFPAGRYKITAQIISSQFVKIKSMGTVIFETSVSNDSAFWFTPSAGDPTFTTIMNKQQWFRSPFINGTDGGFVFINKLAKASSNSTAIELGSRTDLGGKPFSRFSVCDVAAENYNRGIKFNHFNNYIGSFERIHLELNNINVSFGTDGQNVVNSGENIHFSDSVFAIADTAFEWLVDGFDLRLVNCSMDFMQRVFYMKRGWRNISVFGGHIEGIGTRADDTVIKGGIAVFEVTNGADSIVHLSINGTSALLGRRSMFRSSVANKLRVSLENFHYRSVDTNASADMAWLADDEVIVDKKNMFFQGEGILPSKQVNQMANWNFKNEIDTVGTDVSTTPPTGFTASKQYFTSAKIVSTEGYGGGKALEFISNNDSGFFKLTSGYYPVKAGQTVMASAGVKSSNIIKSGLRVRVNFYDNNNVLLNSGATNLVSTTNFQNNVWNYPIKSRIEVAPLGTVKYTVEYSLVDCNGVAGYLSGLYSVVCD